MATDPQDVLAQINSSAIELGDRLPKIGETVADLEAEAKARAELRADNEALRATLATLPPGNTTVNAIRAATPANADLTRRLQDRLNPTE